jgi:hypothetical protein
MRPQEFEAGVARLIAETAKINAEATWPPLLVPAGVFSAALAAAKRVYAESSCAGRATGVEDGSRTMVGR